MKRKYKLVDGRKDESFRCQSFVETPHVLHDSVLAQPIGMLLTFGNQENGRVPLRRVLRLDHSARLEILQLRSELLLSCPWHWVGFDELRNRGLLQLKVNVTTLIPTYVGVATGKYLGKGPQQ